MPSITLQSAVRSLCLLFTRNSAVISRGGFTSDASLYCWWSSLIFSFKFTIFLRGSGEKERNRARQISWVKFHSPQIIPLHQRCPDVTYMPFYTYRITINITNSRRTWLRHNISDFWLKTLLMKNKNQLSSDISSFEKLQRSKSLPATTKWDSRGSLEHCSYITITDLIILSPKLSIQRVFTVTRPLLLPL